MKRIFALLLISACVIFKGGISAAQNNSSSTESIEISAQPPILDVHMPLQTTPKEAYFFVEMMQGELIRLRATFVPPFRNGEAGRNELDKTGGEWLFGAYLPENFASTLVKFSLLLNVDGEAKYLPPQSKVIVSNNENIASVDLLRELVENKKKELESIYEEYNRNLKTLKKLRLDVDLIADIGRIVDIRDEKQKTVQETKNLDRDAIALNELLLLVRNQGNPNNFSRREAELIKQIGQLAEAAKSVEMTEHARRREVEEKNRRKMEIVQATQGDSSEFLSRKLVALKRRREELEKIHNDTAKPEELHSSEKVEN